MIFLPILVFGLGLIIGSFLNVVIFRLNTGRSVAVGRSKCSVCSRTLSWYELIPVFSFLGLRGRCKTCKGQISFQYPVVELSTALVFLLIYARVFLTNGFSFISIISFLGGSIAASMLVVIFVYDLRHKIIPDKIVYPFIFLSFLSILFKALTIEGFLLLPAIIAGPLLALPFFLIWYFSKGKSMGFGDVKLALGMGWFVGILGSIAVFFLAFWIGAGLGLLLLAFEKAKMKSQIPFAPFLIIAFFIVTIWGVTLQGVFPLW